MIKYSVIIPTYNSGKTLKQCLDSVVSQSYPNWEVSLMDGASKDETIMIANSYNDLRIKVHSEPDKGVYDAMNKGIDKSCGEWLLFLGSDDYLYNKDVLATMEPHLTQNYDVVYGEPISHWSEQHRGEWSLEKLEANRVHQAIFYNKRFFGKDIRYNLKYPICADFDINLRWFLNTKYKHRYVPVEVAVFGDGGLSSRVEDTNFIKDIGLNKLRYNRGVLTPLYKKRAARQYIKANPEKYFFNTILQIYVLVMYILCKIDL